MRPWLGGPEFWICSWLDLLPRLLLDVEDPDIRVADSLVDTSKDEEPSVVEGKGCMPCSSRGWIRSR